jgi:hypothetical protein
VADRIPEARRTAPYSEWQDRSAAIADGICEVTLAASFPWSVIVLEQ